MRARAQVAHAATAADEATQAARNAGLQAGLAAAVLADSLRATAAGALPSPGAGGPGLASEPGFGRRDADGGAGPGAGAGGERQGTEGGDPNPIPNGRSGDGGLMQLCTRFAAAHLALQERYLEEAAQRRALHNQLIDLKARAAGRARGCAWPRACACSRCRGNSSQVEWPVSSPRKREHMKGLGGRMEDVLVAERMCTLGS